MTVRELKDALEYFPDQMVVWLEGGILTRIIPETRTDEPFVMLLPPPPSEWPPERKL
jgi:hypothetical protein